MNERQIDRAYGELTRLRRRITGIRFREMARLANSIGFYRVPGGKEPNFEKEGRPYPISIPDHSKPLAPPTARRILDFLESELAWEEGQVHPS